MKGIYVIKSEKHFYIGLSGDLEKREREHWYRLKNNNHPNPKLQSVFNKGYNLEFEIIQECEEEDLEHLEKVWFDLFCIFYPDKEPLNLKECGSRPIMSYETKECMSKSKCTNKYDFSQRYIVVNSTSEELLYVGTILEISKYLNISLNTLTRSNIMYSDVLKCHISVYEALEFVPIEDEIYPCVDY